MKKYIAEFIGTAVLSLAVLGSILVSANITGSVSAGLTLALLVFSIGSISGAHVNPVVTLGLWSLGKIKSVDVGFYLLAQFAGAALALIIARMFGIVPPLSTDFTTVSLFAELCGALVFTFGIASVILKKESGTHKTDLSAPFVIGGSLTLGATIAAGLHSYGILNPAVAFSLGAFNLAYALGPILGAVLGMWMYTYLVCDCEGDCATDCTCPIKGISVKIKK